MNNITKFNATNEQIQAAFKAAGLGEIKNIEELSDGCFNRIFSAVDLSDNKYVIKFAPKKDATVLTYEKNLLASEVKYYQLIQEKTKIITPKIAYVDFSESIVPTAYFIMEFLKGVRLDKVKLTEQDKQKVDEKMAWILSEFHKIEGIGYGYEHVGLKSNWKDALCDMTQSLIDDCEFFNKKCKIGKKLLTYIDKFSGELENVPCVLVNFDLHSMNIFYNKTKSGEVELAVLDVERCLFGDAIGDFVIQEWGKSLSKKSLVKLYNKYANNLITFSKNEEIRLKIMMAYLAVIMFAERFSRFSSISKIFNPIYIMGSFAYESFARIAFSNLKRLSK